MPKSRVKTQSKTNSSLLAVNILRGLFQCSNFISPNEYSEKTIGLLAFFLRQSLGEINFSEIFDEGVRLIQQKEPVDFVKLLEDTRRGLPEIPASIEKCLMINRLITYIQEDESRFLTTLSDILTKMKTRMTDNQLNQMIRYPEDFRQREKDFHRRRDIQNMRHLFYSSPTEVEAPNLIYLQNRTTEHLSYLIERQNFRNIGLDEIEKIFSTSFMIIYQSHSGVNPVLVYTRYGSTYTAKGSVIIVSLLHDFMQSHPDVIELYDIVPILSPLPPHYKLEEPQKLSWKTCQLQISPDETPRTIQYAELTSITIKQTTSTNKQIHFADNLHSLTFRIQFHLYLSEHKISKNYQIPLESLPFAIGAHTDHISYLSTKVMLAEIQRFCQLVDVKVISNFVLRYFIHRTGVEPKQDLRTYLEEELTRAKTERKNCQSLEDIYMDFLAQFVHQVEFMAKHPILAMFYADGLFLGPCNSRRAAQIMIRSANLNSPIVGLRFNSIKTNYQLTASTTSSSKSMKLPTPFVRVDIDNPCTNIFQKCTFDSSILTTDICKFVCTANTETASDDIRILFNFANGTNSTTYKDFTKYYDTRLHEVCKVDQNYKPLTDLLRDIKDDRGNTSVNGGQTAHSFRVSRPILLTSMTTSSNETDYGGTGRCNYRPIPSDSYSNNDTSLPNIFPSSNLQPLDCSKEEELIQYVFSNPDLMMKILTRFNNLQISTAPEPVQQQQQLQSQMSYANQGQSPMFYPNRQQASSTPVPMHSQYYPQVSYASQQQQFYPQQQLSSCMVHNQPIDPNQCQPISAFPSNSIHTLPQQHQTQIENFQITDNVLALSNPSFDQPLSTDQISSDAMNTNDYDWSNGIFPSRNNK